MKPGGLVYTVTDVKDLHNWQVQKLTEHPMFELLTDEETKDDPCVALMRGGTDEARKVIRNEGNIWHAVFRKRDVSKDQAAIHKEMMANFYN